MSEPRKKRSAVILLMALVGSGAFGRVVGVQGTTAGQLAIAGPVRACNVHNPGGPIAVELWQEESVWVEVRRADGSLAGADSVKTQMGRDAELTIWTNPVEGETLTLRVNAPVSARVTVRGGAGDVTVKGMANGMSVETTTGAIRVFVGASAGADLSLRSRAGAVRSDLALEMTGTPERGSLEGKLNGGGAPVMLRSLSGDIEVMPESAASGQTAGMNAPGKRPAPSGNRQQSMRGSLPSGVIDRILAARTEEESGSLKPLQKKRADAKLVEASTGARIRAQSRLVLLTVTAADAASKRVLDLTKEEFRIMENGVEQLVAIFEPVSAPLQIFLLLDLSGSTESKIKIVRDASKKFVDALQAQDRLAVAGFTSRFMVASDFTSDKKMLKERIGDIKNRQGGTHFYKALWQTLDELAVAQGTRKAIVVMTDGVDNELGVNRDPAVAEADFKALKERLGEEDVTVFPVYLNTEYEMVVKRGAQGGEDSTSYKKAREQLQEIAALTGGEVFRAERAEDLAAAFGQVVMALRTYYTVGYYPPRREGDSGEWRNVKVEVGRAGVKARTRSGYFVP